MPMGNVKGGLNCRVCIDCEPMVTCGETMIHSYRCYGEGASAPLKKDFATGKAQPPRKVPQWCPHRKKGKE